MEPHATIALWNGDKLTVYDATQGVSNTAQNLAELFELAPEDVHVIDPFVGGGFGCKGQSWPHTPIAALAARVAKRPVKLVAHAAADVQLGRSSSARRARRIVMPRSATAIWLRSSIVCLLAYVADR